MNPDSITDLQREPLSAAEGELVDTLLKQGEMSLLKGDPSGLDLFERASQIDPSNGHLFYRQGLSLFEYGSEEGREKFLLVACKKFKIASALNPESFFIWQVWANALSLLGAFHRQHHYFLQAQDKYQKAIALSENQSSDILADLHWDYGLVLSHIAEHSGEALDLQLAIEAFQKASSFQEKLPSKFWHDFGHACLELASRINDIRLYVKAINCFKHSLSTTGFSYDAWVSLAKALQMLYVYTHDEDHFSQANECFAAAAQIHPQDVDLWVNWAKFLCESGRRNQDIKRLRSCIEKCTRAYAYDPHQPLLLGIWAEALALLGELSERLDLIYEAQNKISEATNFSSDLPDLWYSYGMCLTSFARYFHDIDYFYQAVEQFQLGLSIDRTCDRNWHAMGSTYAIIGQLEGDVPSLEKACRFYTKAIDLKNSSYYIYDYALTLSKLGEATHRQQWLEQAITQFEHALNMQKNAIYLHPDWLFNYACTLDMLGDFYEEDSYYLRAIEIFSHVLTIDPDFPELHHHLALALSHYGELQSEVENFYKALHHYRLALKQDEENEQVILDWGLTLINLAEHTQDAAETDQLYRDAEHRLIQAAKLGSLQSYYHLSCLYSLLGQYEKAMRYLEKARRFESLPPLEEILQDDWLDGLRNTAHFRDFLSQMEKRSIPD